MAVKKVSAFVALLGLLANCQCRQLQAPAPAIDAPCISSWTAQLDATLANTLYTSSNGLGTANIHVEDDESLLFQVEVPVGGRIKGVLLQSGLAAVEAEAVAVELTTQMSDAVTGRLSSNDTSFDLAMEILKAGKAHLAVEVLASQPMILVGALRDDCEAQTTEVTVTWVTEQQVPACNVPGFTELYMIACPNFGQRVEQTCGVHFDDVVVASAYDSEGKMVANRISACLPQNCDPCSADLDNDMVVVEFQEDPLFYREAQSCQQPGFEAYYPVPTTCTNLPDRVLDFCGVRIEDVLQASASSLGLTQEGICIPQGCDPCAAYPNEEATLAELSGASPQCSNSYLFTKPYSIPAGCGYFPDALMSGCGLEAEAVADASGMSSYPQFAGFGEGKTVCLPEICEPCSQPQQQVSLTQS